MKKFTKGKYELVMGGSEDAGNYSVWENNRVLGSFTEREKAESLFTSRVKGCYGLNK